MSLINSLLSRLRYFDITGNDGSIYIRRYKLLRCRRGNVYLHHIRRGDSDRCLHDHPWGFVSIILAGGYREQMQDGTFWRRPGQVLFRAAETAHRIEVDRPAWSLVITGQRVRQWGFWTIFGWRPFEVGKDSPICEQTLSKEESNGYQNRKYHFRVPGRVTESSIRSGNGNSAQTAYDDGANKAAEGGPQRSMPMRQREEVQTVSPSPAMIRGGDDAPYESDTMNFTGES